MKPLTVILATVLASLATASARADHSRVHVGVSFGSSHPAPIYAVAPRSVECGPRASVVIPVSRFTPARGHWATVTVKTWVPGRWVMGRDRWGRRVRVFENGFYALRTERVWVDSHRHG